MTTTATRDRALRMRNIAAVVLAGTLQAIVLVPFTVGSGLLAPQWAVTAFLALWVVGAYALVRVARRRPLAAPIVPVVNAALLWLAIAAGGQWLGWTA